MDGLTSTKRFSHYLIMILTLVILSACTSKLTQREQPPALFSELTNDSAFFLNKAELKSEPESLPWQFIALQALIAEQKPTMANSVIEYLQGQQLTVVQKNELNLLIADNLNIQNQSNNALKLLNRINTKQLSEIGFVYFLKLQTQVQIDKEYYHLASDNLLLLTPLLKTDEEKQKYNDLLLTQLSMLPSELLNQYQTEAKEAPIEPSALDFAEQQLDARKIIISEQTAPIDPIKQGWYELASIYQRYQLRPNQLIRSVDDWKNRYATHPAFYFMPTQLTNLPELSPYQPENIAVLLPLSGRFKEEAQAIQYGILHAYYEQQNRIKNSQPATATAVKFHFYDTQSQSIEQIIGQLESNHIDFVIGPLLKDKVEEFLPLATKIPVLALNSFPKQIPSEKEPVEVPQSTELDSLASQIPWHYSFPLSPEEEAKQAARFIFASAHKKPLLLAADSAYGERITEAFTKEWATLSADQQAAETYLFDSNTQLAPLIAQALQTKDSKNRITQMKLITKLPLETETRSRRDVDAIYIISKRNELLMLKAFIAVSISPFAKTIPLYANSRSHLDDQQKNELSKLTFSDSPFLLDINNESFKKVYNAWGKQPFARLRLFALGHDSYQLIGDLIALQNDENNTLKGLTGQLSLNSDNMVQVELSWAKYQGGRLIEISAPISAE